MKQSLICLFFLFAIPLSYGSALKLKKGRWIASMQLSKTDVLPFELIVSQVKGQYHLTVKNGEEEILLSKMKDLKNDSIEVEFPYFRSVLRFKIHSKKRISGNWYNLYKKNYKIPFEAEFNQKDLRFSHISSKDLYADPQGKWEVHFEPGTTGTYPAVGLFEKSSHKNEYSGTFLTETGDYRYLSGNAIGDSIYLSCFDGSHAFLFKAVKKNDSLIGTFYSGSHWKSEWIALKNANFNLKSPEELTYVTDKPLQLELKTLDGEPYLYPNNDLQGKVVIIQIMGSWCPNCLDETHYYKQLYTNYHADGLEIISVGYEIGDSFEDHSANIKRLKEKLNLDFTFLVGGNAKKALASEHFSALNQIISFPTSIYIGRDGRIRRVHTGFNGPGTGKLYTDYVQQTNALIEGLLAE
jgi:thiol-disulfide isomerase/thioredoxin